MSRLICELVISSIKVTAVEWLGAARADFRVTTQKCCEAIDRKLMGGGVYGQPFGVGGVYG
jgi:hypothetical protein